MSDCAFPFCKDDAASAELMCRVHATPPMCTCGSEATTQIHTGTLIRPTGNVATYAWRCFECAREADIERDISRSA